MSPKRYLARFTSADGESMVYDFPTNRYEWEPDEPTRSPRAKVSGAEFAVRLLGDKPVLRDVASHTVRCFFVGTAQEQDAEIDDMRQKLYEGAFGWVWTKGYVDDDGETVEEWRRARAEISEMPRYRVSFDQQAHTPLVLSFNVFSEFFLEDPKAVTQTITSSPTNVVVNNPGRYTATRVIIRITPKASGGATNVKIVNPENGHEFESTRDSVSTNDRWLLDTVRPAVEYSDDAGDTYHGDFANYVRPPQGYYIFDLVAGEQTLVVTCDGTPNFDLEVSFDVPV